MNKLSRAFLSFFAALCLSAFASAALLAQEATHRAKALGIPTLDDMAGEWTPMGDVANPPSLHNGHNMLIVDRDLTSYFFSPGGWLYNLAAYADAKEPSVWRRGYPAVKLQLDGRVYPAEESKQGGYRALRRNLHCNGIAVETDTRMVHEQRGVLTRITFTNTTLLPRKFRAALSMPGSLQPDGIGVANEFQRSGVISIIRPTKKPDAVEIDAYIVAIWKWDITLPAGGSFTLGFTVGDETTKISDKDGFIQGDIGNEKGSKTDARVADWAGRFDAVFAECKEAWENRWADAFTPGNRHFSGHLPVLVTDDAALGRNYYMGVYSLLSVESHAIRPAPKVFRHARRARRRDLVLRRHRRAAHDLGFARTRRHEGELRRWLVQNLRNGAWIDSQDRGF